MTHDKMLGQLGLFDTRVPRYTSYPTTPMFSHGIGTDFQRDCLEVLDPDDPLSVYVHIPFCERLCWFCACHTQGTTNRSVIENYLEALARELKSLSRTMPGRMRMSRLHWGSGTPTILSPRHIVWLGNLLKATFDQDAALEFSVEIDPTLIDREKIRALSDIGMTRASIGIQDFLPDVQRAIGRLQSYEMTRDTVLGLRNVGISSLNMDLVYGLPFQTLDTLEDTIRQVLTLDPDRIALFGYAHVPWVSRRQKLIKEETLPDGALRHALAERAAKMFVEAGYEAIGIDHFAKPDDALAQAARDGSLRRNFQGYTEDDCQTLIGLGASSLSRFPQGYVQNAAAVAAYKERVEENGLAGCRGHALCDDDRVRARVIEMIMCDFQIDLAGLLHQFGAISHSFMPLHEEVLAQYAPVMERRGSIIEIAPEGRALARIIAHAYDAYKSEDAQYSKAS